MRYGGKNSERPIREIRNPQWLRFVKVYSRNLYWDDPFVYINEAVSEIFECDHVAKNADDFVESCNKVLENWNKELKPLGVVLRLGKGSPFEKRRRPYAIRIYRKESKAYSEVDIIKMYEKIQLTRLLETPSTSIWSKLKEYETVKPEDIIGHFSEKRGFFEEELKNAFDRIALFLNWWRKEFKELTTRKELMNLPVASFFGSIGLNEITNILLVSFFSAYNGFFRTAFKDFRDLIEWLSLIIFIDCLYPKYIEENREPLQEPYYNALMDGDWHKILVMGSKEDKITDIKGLSSSIEKRIFDPNDKFFNERGISKKQFIEGIKRHLSTPLFLVSTGRILCHEHAEEMKVKHYLSYKDIHTDLANDIRHIVYILETGEDYLPPHIHDLEKLEEISKGLSRFVVPSQCEKCGKDAGEDTIYAIRIPTSNVLSYLSWKRLNLSKEFIKTLQEKYDSYSWFVHPYPQTKQYFPFTSKDELEMWSKELNTLLCIMSSVLCNLIAYFRTNFNEKFSDVLKNTDKCKKCQYRANNFRELTPFMIKKLWPKYLDSHT
jgi:predicted Zn-ribbon and HTH transcriptional regulator